MLLDDATLQVPFLADLVTMADPTSRWSFLNYLKQTGNLYPFYIRESFYPLRKEYDDYCRWAAERLGSVRFGQPVVEVEHDGTAYVVRTGTGEEHRARRLVLGVGTSPSVPECMEDLLAGSGVSTTASASASACSTTGTVLHSADYLPHKARLQWLDSITIVGSGQSAAEIYYDLLAESPDHGYHLTWLTRSPRFFPMEYTKLTLEMTSPEYTAYFQGLPELTRRRLLREQRSLYKGISGDLVDAIFDLHYRLRVTGDGPRTTLMTNTAVTGVTHDGGALRPRAAPRGDRRAFGLRTDGLVLATGYSARGAGLPRRRARPDRVRRARPLRRLSDLRCRPRRRGDLRAERRGAQPRVRGAGPRHGRLPQLRAGRRDVRPGGLPGREADRGAELRRPRPPAAGPMTLEPLQLPRDLGRLHAWVTHPKAVYWEMQGASVQDVATEYTLIDEDPHHDAWLGRVDGAPAFLAETYDPFHSELARPARSSGRATWACTCWWRRPTRRARASPVRCSAR